MARGVAIALGDVMFYTPKRSRARARPAGNKQEAGSMQADTINALAGVNVLNGLDEEQLGVLASRMEVRSVAAGERIVTEAEKGTHLYIIAEGEVQVLLPEKGHGTTRFTDVLLARLGPGELFGEYAFVDMRPAAASVVALRDCRLLQIEYGELHKILDQHCAIARRFLENLLLLMIDRLRADDRELDAFSGS